MELLGQNIGPSKMNCLHFYGSCDDRYYTSYKITRIVVLGIVLALGGLFNSEGKTSVKTKGV